ncbi:stamen-specific protein FIL1-like [Quillaja saponaria]|uniref:Stamen-specific protein FIL1-like n=1 Tax=Quillaja saponaria TaxID=32244 RepID=A0AAD7M7F2_QUISA|nr:stamen-specific protein FIL1-like [Quillaja saponaria]
MHCDISKSVGKESRIILKKFVRFELIMAAFKSLVSLSSQAAVLLLLLLALGMETKTAKAQTCASQLTNLNVCAPFVVPGATNTNPSADCCGALQAVPHDCICNTLRIASRLPSQCNLPALTCSN